MNIFLRTVYDQIQIQKKCAAYKDGYAWPGLYLQVADPIEISYLTRKIYPCLDDARLVVEETFFGQLQSMENYPVYNKFVKECIEAPWLVYAGTFQKLYIEQNLDRFEHIMQTRARNYLPTIFVTSTSIEMLPDILSRSTLYMIRELRHIQSFGLPRRSLNDNLSETTKYNNLLVVA